MDMLGLILLIVMVGGYVWYVSIIRLKNNTREALSGIDVQLKKRVDLIPNILRIAQRFMTHERQLMEEITQLRSQVEGEFNKSSSSEVEERFVLEELLSKKMSQFNLAVEAYPDLKTDKTMMRAMQTYSEVEAQISASRRFYNSAVKSLNNSVQIFPGNFIAMLAGVGAMPFFEADEESKKPVDADDYLK
jgi:LemA protein